jgi:hypothetical protein
MPIPKPNNTETQQQYITRCYKAIKDEYPTAAQSFAICYQKYRDRNK